jgi:hypothetical protein
LIACSINDARPAVDKEGLVRVTRSPERRLPALRGNL